MAARKQDFSVLQIIKSVDKPIELAQSNTQLFRNKIEYLCE